MKPRIQFAKSTDGVSIAYYAIGQGPAVLFLMMPSFRLEVQTAATEVEVPVTKEVRG